MTKNEQAHALLLKNPDMKAKELAKKLKTNVTYAYTLIANFKKSPAGVTLARPKERMQTAAVLTSNESVGVERDSEGYRLIELGDRKSTRLNSSH